MDYGLIIKELFASMTGEEKKVMQAHQASRAIETTEREFIGFMICLCLFLCQRGVLPKFRYVQGKEGVYYAKIAQVLCEQRGVAV